MPGDFVGTIQFCISKAAAGAVGVDASCRIRRAARGVDDRVETVMLRPPENGVRVTCDGKIAEELLEALRERAMTASSPNVRAECDHAANIIVESFWAAYESYSSSIHPDGPFDSKPEVLEE